MLQGAWSSSVFPTEPRHQREPNDAFCLCPTTIRSHFSSAARRQISSTGSPTARWPATLKPFCVSCCRPSLRTSCARLLAYFASSPRTGARSASSKGVGGIQAEREILAVLSECQLIACYVHGTVGRLIENRSGSVEPGAGP